MSLVGQLLKSLSCLVAKLCSVLGCSLVEQTYYINCQRCLITKRLKTLKAVFGAQDLSLRAQNELWRGRNRRKTSPKELWASYLEVMEVSGAPRGDQESFKEVFKSSKLTIHGVCQVIMSPQGAVGSPQRAPKELLESQNEGQSSPEELHRAFRELRERS